MISCIENFNSQDILRPCNFGYCALGSQNNGFFENLEILHYPNAPNASILCSTGQMTAVSTKALTRAFELLAPFQDCTNLPICLIQYYSQHSEFQLKYSE